MEEKPIEVVTEDSLGLRHAVRLEREKVIHTFSDEKSALHGVPTVRCGQSTTANRSESRLWVTMGKVYEAVRVEMYKAGTLPWTSTVSLHHIAFISGYRLWGRTKPSTQTVGDRAMVKLLARGNRVDNGETSGIRVQVGSAWQGIVSTANGGHPAYRFSSDDWGEGVFEYECSPCRMLVQMKTIEIDHFSDFFGVANDLLGNQTTPLSTTSIPRIWTQGKIRFAMRCTMPRYRQRRNVVGFEREKMGRKPIEVVTEDSLGLCHAVWFEREKVIHTFGGEKYALLWVLTVRCGRSTTAIGVNRTKSTVVETSTSHQSQDRVLLSLLSARRRLEFRTLVRPSVGLRRWNSFIGWILEEGMTDGLEVLPVYVHDRADSYKPLLITLPATNFMFLEKSKTVKAVQPSFADNP
ncbi:hypothetical protein F5141DRAFT_1065582 [Pisolithus sp. B1]|nr:hypothetical protein F5141DRAFT_1065582 [Pisolithus sp. B1]